MAVFLTPQTQQFLEDMKAYTGKSLVDMTPGEARVASEAFIATVQGPLETMAALHEIEFPSHGIQPGTVRARLYQATPTVRPLLIYLHGGGWVRGSLQSYDALCRRLAAWSHHHVLSVEYRLAPEYKFPTAVDDAEAAWHWAVAHGAEFLCQPHRIAMGGDSAGGNLSAAVVARLAAKNARCPDALLLLYPSLDMTLSLPSVQSLGEGYFLTRAGICWFRDHYMNTTSEYTSVDASPLLSLHLDRFPRTIVVTASADPLIDDGRVFADTLQSRQVPVSYKCFEGVVHGFMNMFTIFPEAAAALRWVSMELNVTNTYDTGLKR